MTIRFRARITHTNLRKAFLSDLIESNAVPVIRLTEVFRQAATSWIIKAAHQINAGRMPVFPSKEEKGDCYFLSVEDNEQMPEILTTLVRTRLPKACGVNPIKDIQILCPMNRGSAGARTLNEVLQLAFNPPTEASVLKFGTKFSVGDKVMQIENNYDRDVFNGDIGFVTRLDAEEEELTVDFDVTPTESWTSLCSAMPRPFTSPRGANIRSWYCRSQCNTM